MMHIFSSFVSRGFFDSHALEGKGLASALSWADCRRRRRCRRIKNRTRATLRVKTIFATVQLFPACSPFHAVAATSRVRPVHQTLPSSPPIYGVSTGRGEGVAGVVLLGSPPSESQSRGDAEDNAGEEKHRCEAADIRAPRRPSVRSARPPPCTESSYRSHKVPHTASRSARRALVTFSLLGTTHLRLRRWCCGGKADGESTDQ